jgi:lipase chaperone LimK
VSRAFYRTVGAVVLATALAGGLWWWTAAAPSAARKAASANERIQPGADVRTGASPDTAQAAADPLATSSLRGTAVDGDVRFDARGALVLDTELRRFFDYHLSLIGEWPLSKIRDRMKQTLLARFDPMRAETVLGHFDRYTGYLQALSDSRIGDEPDAARRLDAVRRLRHDRLGPEMSEGFFAEEDALAALTLQRMRIAGDPDMSAERKREALDALDRDAGYAARESAGLAEQAERLERNGLAPAERDAERAARWGADAARRLAALDAERAAWDARVRRYADARARIDADPRLDPQGRARAVAILRGRMFSAEEQRRIASLEAIGQLEATLSQ